MKVELEGLFISGLLSVSVQVSRIILSCTAFFIKWLFVMFGFRSAWFGTFSWFGVLALTSNVVARTTLSSARALAGIRSDFQLYALFIHGSMAQAGATKRVLPKQSWWKCAGYKRAEHGYSTCNQGNLRSTLSYHCKGQPYLMLNTA